MKPYRILSLACLCMVFVLGACTADPTSAPVGNVENQEIVPEQEFSQELHDQLPKAIKDAGKIVFVNRGSFPPFDIIEGSATTGVSADIAAAIGQVLNVDIEHQTVDSLATVLTGMQAGRYDADLGPIGDFQERQKQATFVDWVEEEVVFAVREGNPSSISDLNSTCGQRIAVQAANSAERVINTQSETCVAEGRAPVEVQAYRDQPSSILAVQSGRADAFFSSRGPLTYFVEQADGQLELAGVGMYNGFDKLYQGAVVPVGSSLGPVLLTVFEQLRANGSYESIMSNWKIEGNMIDEFGINRGLN